MKTRIRLTGIIGILMLVQMACGLRAGSSYRATEIAAGATKGAPTAVEAFKRTQTALAPKNEVKKTSEPIWDTLNLPELGASPTPSPSPTLPTVIGRLTTKGAESEDWHWFQGLPPMTQTSTYQYSPKGLGQLTGGQALDVIETADADHWFKVIIRGWIEKSALSPDDGRILGFCHTWDHPEKMELCHAHLFGSIDRGDIIGQLQPMTEYRILSESDSPDTMYFVEIIGWFQLDNIDNFERN